MKHAWLASWLALGCSASSATSWEYVRCTATSDCETGASCIDVTWRDGSGGMCTAACNGQSDCARGGRCIDVTRDGSFRCFEPCATDSNCGAGFICQPLSVGGSVCLPQ